MLCLARNYHLFSFKGSTTLPQIEISDEDLSFLKNLAHEIDSQDNAATAHPYYIVVRTSRQIILPQGHGSGEAVYHDEDGDDPATSLYKSLEEAAEAFSRYGYADIQERLDALIEYGTDEIEEDHNVFFTRKGYEKHMELNGHNYRGDWFQKPHSYTHHAFRNPEIKTLLEIVRRLSTT
jgi:hypothetical protein